MKAPKSDDRKPAEPARGPDLAGAEAAMRRAAERARRRAAENGTPIAVFQDGKVVWVDVGREVLENEKTERRHDAG